MAILLDYVLFIETKLLLSYVLLICQSYLYRVSFLRIRCPPMFIMSGVSKNAALNISPVIHTHELTWEDPIVVLTGFRQQPRLIIIQNLCLQTCLYTYKKISFLYNFKVGISEDGYLILVWFAAGRGKSVIDCLIALLKYRPYSTCKFRYDLGCLTRIFAKRRSDIRQ